MGDVTFSGAGLGSWPTVYSCVGSLGSFEISSVGILTVFTDMRSEPSDHLLKRRYVDFRGTASVDFHGTPSVDFRGTAFVCCLASPFAGVHLKSPEARVFILSSSGYLSHCWSTLWMPPKEVWAFACPRFFILSFLLWSWNARLQTMVCSRNFSVALQHLMTLM